MVSDPDLQLPARASVRWTHDKTASRWIAAAMRNRRPLSVTS
jgi:hypothetical protein